MAIGTTAAIIGSAVIAAGATVASAAMAPGAPDAPDYAAANREAIMADIETLPLRKKIEAAAALGETITYKDPETGEEKTADFSGFGDVDQSMAEVEAQLAAADMIAKKTLEIQDTYGTQFIEARLKELEASDPEGFAVRKEMGQQALDELQLGYDLAPGMESQIVQAERAGQAARGNILGQSAGAAEALKVGDAAFRMRQQRLANAAAFLSGTTPAAQFGAISTAQAGAAPVATPAIQQGIGVNQAAGAQGAQYAMQAYGQQSANAMNWYQNNPWTTMLGSLAGAGTQAGVGMAVNKWGG